MSLRTTIYYMETRGSSSQGSFIENEWSRLAALLSSSMHTRGSDFGLYDGSDLETRLLVGWLGLMLWLFVGPTGVYLLDFLCSGIQFYYC